MEIRYKKIFRNGSLILGFLLIFVLGMYVGYTNIGEASKIVNIIAKEPPVEISKNDKDINFNSFWKVWNILNEKSPEASTVDSETRIYGAISGLVDSFDDPYTVFFNPTESKLFTDSINGSFGGVGMEVGMKDDILTVVAPIKDTPAYKAGIKAGDKILKIDETITTDLKVDEAIKLIRGEIGTKVVITIVRGEDYEPMEFSIIRESIQIPTLDTEKREDGIFVISLYNFSGSSENLFKKAMNEFKESGFQKLIIDLRGNPGGYLESAVNISSYFLEKGTVIVRESGKDLKNEQVFRSKGYNLFSGKEKLVVLVDGGSASASEIMAGALEEQGVATMIGDKTYGKGSVQEVIPVTDDTVIKITVANWYTPKGVSISKNGLTPSIIVPYEKDEKNKDKDNQMERAVIFLKTGK